MPLHASPSDYLTTLAVEPPPGIILAINTVPDKLTAAWDAVKDDPKGPNPSLGFDVVDDKAVKVQNKAASFMPVITATVLAAQQTDVAKAIKEGIDKLAEGMPVFMKALDELKSLHPAIGVVVLVFKTVYTLELKRRENDKKILSLFVGMRDMMGALFLLKDIENDKVIGPNGISLEDPSEKEASGEGVAEFCLGCKTFWNSCSCLRIGAKISIFELTMHASQGIDKANAKLDAIGGALNEQMDAMKALFQQLALKEDDKLLFELEKAEGKVSGTSKGDVGRTFREQSKDTNLSAINLKRDIFEDPSIAVEKNLSVVLSQRESDRVIQEVKGGPHERILDRSIHEIGTDMVHTMFPFIRRGMKALNLTDSEGLVSGAESALGMSTSGINYPVDPDAWAVKYIDIIRLQPIMEAIDDDSSGFITIGEMNRFTASRPIDWRLVSLHIQNISYLTEFSLPHWVAYWAVGFRASIIDYAHKMEELFAKMDGIRTGSVHSLIAPLLSLESWKDDNDKFKSYLEAEEARLFECAPASLIDVLQTVFPLLYLLMKRHYEIMRTMRTKVLDSRELWENRNSIACVQEALIYRVVDLMNNFTHQKLTLRKKFEDFAYGMFKYIYDPDTLWAGAHMLDLDPQTTPYDDANEDQTILVDEFIRFEISDEPSLDYWVYDGHSIEDVPSYGNA
ncbi:hypothetical protein F5148DRAFT_1319727 [Russula earlei]|uniref:Uncharacterized protein n=1 Tax=Russula earlei TaxID=71964 RepID=A0ACC0U3M2_9AGAM|nr:hypothetical protein F5148DRAFT_1319727 [Russula earlei]